MECFGGIPRQRKNVPREMLKACALLFIKRRAKAVATFVFESLNLHGPLILIELTLKGINA